jgi:hypothetical protein
MDTIRRGWSARAAALAAALARTASAATTYRVHAWIMI